MQFFKFIGIVLLISVVNFLSVFAQTTQTQLANQQEQIRSLFNAENYNYALQELDKIILKNPESIFARSWQVLVYLDRKDSLETGKGTLYKQNYPLYNFRQILENVQFLRNNAANNEIEDQVRRNALNRYDALFADLRIDLTQTPLLGFYRVRFDMQFRKPFALKKIQEKRFAEINKNLAAGNFLYFNQIDEQQKKFYTLIRGLPLLKQFEAGYDIILNRSGDSLFVEFNPEYQENLTLSATDLDSAYYDIPGQYVLLFFDKGKEVSFNTSKKHIFRKDLKNRQAFLFPVDAVENIVIRTPKPLWERFVLWSGVGLLTGILFSTVN